MVLFKANCTVFFCSFEVARGDNVLNSGKDMNSVSHLTFIQLVI